MQSFLPKLFTVLKGYNRKIFLNDLSAGIIVAIIALPLSIALAIASGVSPEKGLYTAIIGGFIVSFLGGSRVQIGGPTGAFVVIVFGILNQYGMGGLVTATIMAGFFLIIMGVFQLGSMIKYIPYPITTGFTGGIAVTIFSTQVKDFLGIQAEGAPSKFVEQWEFYFSHLDTIHLHTLFIGILSLLILIFWPKISKKIPGSLIAVIASTLIVLLFNLDVETIGSRFGEIPSTLPKPTLPFATFDTVKELLHPSITIALLAAIESLLSAVVADGMIGGKHRPNMELIAQGAANIASAVFGGIPVTGAIARTAANIKNGGKTPISGIIHSIVIFIIMTFFMPYAKLIPMSCLAAILVMVAYNMSEWRAFVNLFKAPKSDIAVLLITFILTIFFDLVVAIEIGIVLSSILFMKRMSDVTSVDTIIKEINDQPDTEIDEEMNANNISDKVMVYDINGPFFFGAADTFIDTVRSMQKLPKILVIRMKKVPAMDATACHALQGLLKKCRKNKTKVYFTHVRPQPLKTLQNYGIIDKLGYDSVCSSTDEAIKKAGIA